MQLTEVVSSFLHWPLSTVSVTLIGPLGRLQVRVVIAPWTAENVAIDASLTAQDSTPALPSRSYAAPPHTVRKSKAWLRKPDGQERVARAEEGAMARRAAEGCAEIRAHT